MTNKNLSAIKEHIKKVTHNLNNCLFAISSATLLLQNSDQKESSSKYIGIIEKSCLDATALTQELESIARNDDQ